MLESLPCPEGPEPWLGSVSASQGGQPSPPRAEGCRHAHTLTLSPPPPRRSPMGSGDSGTYVTWTPLWASVSPLCEGFALESAKTSPRPEQWSGDAHSSAGAQGVTFSGSQEGRLCGFPGPTSWLPASSPACLWVTPGAGPGAVTRPRGPSASLAFVSNDWRATGKGRAMVGGLHRVGRGRKQEGLQQSRGLPSAPRGAVVLACPFQEREAGRAGGSQKRCTRDRAQDSRTALTPGHMGVQEQW